MSGNTSTGGNIGPLSADQWSNLGNFLANIGVSANQRTGGGFLANPTLGAAMSQAGVSNQAYQQQVQESRARQALAGAQTGYIGSQTELNQLQMPFVRARLQMMQNYLGGQMTPQLPEMQGGAAPSAPGLDSGILNWATQGTNVPAPLFGSLINTESGGQNVTNNKSGAIGPAQILPSTAQSPGYGVPSLDAEALQDPRNNLRFGANYLDGIGKSLGLKTADDWSDPANQPKVMTALNVYGGYGKTAAPTQYTAKVLGGMGAAQQGQPQSGELDQQALIRAQQAQQQANQAALMGLPDLAANYRQQSQQWFDLASAGPKAGAEAAAKFPYSMERVSPGGVLAVGGKPAFSVPRISEETQLSGPNAGVTYQQYRSPMSGESIGPAVPTKVSPQAEEQLKGSGQIPVKQIEADNKMIDEEFEHVVANVLPAQKGLLQMRDQIAGADTGALGQFRASMKNYIQTFAPSVAATIGADATPAQIFNKLALMQSGQQERGDLGSRGGYRAIQMYADANPKLDMQPDANRHMVNALLTMQQAQADYAQGANDYFNKQSHAWQQNPTGTTYSSVKNYDSVYASTFTPQMYVSAINALNGAADWKKGLTPKQMQLVAGIVQRTDPTANIIVDGKPLPVSSITRTVSPTQIAAQ